MKTHPPALTVVSCGARERTRLQWEILHEVMQPRALDKKKIAELQGKMAPRGKLIRVK